MSAINNISTPGYLIKRLRDNGYTVNRIFNRYSDSDPRVWTVMINPEHESIFLTCIRNSEEYGDVCFEINDGGVSVQRNFLIKTDSMEVLIRLLLHHGIIGKNKPNIIKYESPQKTTTGG